MFDANTSMDTKDFECVVCMDLMKVPKSLLCGHSFCEECVKGLIRAKAVVCPTCRQSTKLPPKGLATNFTLKSLIERELKRRSALENKADEEAPTRKNPIGKMIKCSSCEEQFTDDKLAVCMVCPETESGAVCFQCLIIKHEGHRWLRMAAVEEERKQEWMNSVDTQFRPHLDECQQPLVTIKKRIERARAVTTDLRLQILSDITRLMEIENAAEIKCTQKKDLLTSTLTSDNWNQPSARTALDAAIVEMREQTDQNNRLRQEADSFAELLDSLAGHYTAWAVNAREGEYRLPRDDEVKLQCMNKRASAALDGVNTKSKATSDSSQRSASDSSRALAGGSQPSAPLRAPVAGPSHRRDSADDPPIDSGGAKINAASAAPKFANRHEMQRKGMVESFLGRLVNGAGRVENGAPDAKKPRVVVESDEEDNEIVAMDAETRGLTAAYRAARTKKHSATPKPTSGSGGTTTAWRRTSSPAFDSEIDEDVALAVHLSLRAQNRGPAPHTARAINTNKRSSSNRTPISTNELDPDDDEDGEDDTSNDDSDRLSDEDDEEDTFDETVTTAEGDGRSSATSASTTDGNETATTASSSRSAGARPAAGRGGGRVARPAHGRLFTRPRRGGARGAGRGAGRGGGRGTARQR